jgi:hypothetical protein
MSTKLHDTPADGGACEAATPMAGSADRLPGRLLKRGEVAEVLGTSVSTVRRLEGTRLDPIVGPGGTRLFREESVRALIVQQTKLTRQAPEVYDGETAGAAFEIFDAGDGPIELVKRLKIHPSAARALYREWSELRGGFFVDASVLVALERTPFLSGLGPITSAGTLLAMLQQVERDFCELCKKRGPTICGVCVTVRLGAARKLAASEYAKYEDRAAARSSQAVVKKARDATGSGT